MFAVTVCDPGTCQGPGLGIDPDPRLLDTLRVA
jgi:hypothetical protein